MDPVLQVIERSNQRGGRMFSLIDLIAAETFTRAQACWLLERIEQGSSWCVGAKPGGAGKTTVMSALLCMLPEDERVVLVNPGTGWEQVGAGECVVAYEISAGHYDAYIWGDNVRKFARLGARGCRIVTNLHADTLEQAREQIVRECGAGDDDFNAFSMFLPISLEQEGSIKRTINTIRYYKHGKWTETGREPSLSVRGMAFNGFVDVCIEKKIYICEQVRAEWLQWVSEHPASSA